MELEVSIPLLGEGLGIKLELGLEIGSLEDGIEEEELVVLSSGFRTSHGPVDVVSGEGLGSIEGGTTGSPLEGGIVGANMTFQGDVSVSMLLFMSNVGAAEAIGDEEGDT